MSVVSRGIEEIVGCVRKGPVGRGLRCQNVASHGFKLCSTLRNRHFCRNHGLAPAFLCFGGLNGVGCGVGAPAITPATPLDWSATSTVLSAATSVLLGSSFTSGGTPSSKSSHCVAWSDVRGRGRLGSAPF